MYKSVEESKIQISELMLPSNTNFGGKIHGGYILKLMDQIAFACAAKHSGSYCVTASVDKVNFLNPIEVGELVTMKASVNYVGTSSMVIGIRVESENIKTGSKKHCNSSYFTMVAVDDNGKTIKVPGLKITTKTDAKRFIKAIKRRESEDERNLDLNKIYKDIDTHLNTLNAYRVQVQIK
ncbi:acyl-CoA thioesterase [Paucihalobacter ruber]|uniref:Acyl-CoA thioesterase n=1 Tax=Paucihalobacter ruber TaxID=2567861 RepID=A0A506PKS9_9FLAO|nr:acyl-CoA thioesterase [Paucihalobacter ruber]TPV33782.1 acyl-CoA thioesterase [Paucihalobacter ruber]